MQIMQNTPGLVVVSLSERNLDRLREQVVRHGAYQIARLTESGVTLIVLAETDELHYRDRQGRDPGEYPWASPGPVGR